MRFLRRIITEMTLVTPRLTRTRLGVMLLLLGVALVWLVTHGLDRQTAVLQAGALGAVMGAGWMAGNARDRAALATALTHPTTPLAIATGRWVAIVVPAALLTMACAMVSGAQVGAAVAGIVAAAAVGAVALTTVLMLGNGAAVTLFLFIGAVGGMAPERLVGLTHPGVARVAAASALELGPALWHYRDIGAGDWFALLHALAWSGLGIVLASSIVARQRTVR